jgi:hypothetical protein
VLPLDFIFEVRPAAMIPRYTGHQPVLEGVIFTGTEPCDTGSF